MSRNTIGSQAQGSGSLTAKDFVFCALFGMLVFAITLVFAGICSLSYQTSWLAHALSSLVAGMAWIYLMHKVPKRGALLVMGVVTAIAGYFMGMFWTGPAGILVGSAVAELVAGAPESRTNVRRALSFSAFMTIFWLGHISLVYLIGADAYIDQCVKAGVTMEFASGMVAVMFTPWMAGIGVATAACAYVGALIGLRVFKKHFEKMGV